MPRTDPVAAVQAAIARYPRFRSLAGIAIRLEDDALTLEGTLPRIAARRLLPRIAAEATGLGIRDRLRIQPASAHDDAGIAADLESALSVETALTGYAIARDAAPGGERSIAIRVRDGVVRLDGRVASLLHRRIAEARAWWTAGVADVDNRLHVEPAEHDSDAAIADAVRAVLERDPRVDATRLAVRAENRIVTLIGVQPEPGQRVAAAQDAWFVPGVHEVDNRIRVLDHRQLDRYADEASRESFPASDPPSITPIVGIGGTAGQRPTTL
ncbi:MAG TPA: BON domain-containing protein [Gammaproteobacteria bacterium]